MVFMKHTTVIFSMWLIAVTAMHSAGQASFDTSVVETTKGVESTVRDSYFKMGEMRLINNNWGSKQLNCNSSYRIFIENDGTFGWEFNRGACGGDNPPPDYPEIEFGQHPFGHLEDSIKPQDLSSTTLLPLQIKDINSASVKIDQMNISMQSAGSWNICFEMWLTTKKPDDIDTGECPYAEIMTFWGWQDGRWACDQTGSLSSGGFAYDLCHKSDEWACGWRYAQFRAKNGPQRSFNGTVDVKAILNWLVSNDGYSQDLWVTRFEVGSEIGDNTNGKVTFKNLTFEVNGVSRSPVFRDPSAISQKPKTIQPQRHTMTMFPAGSRVAIINMQGVRRTVRTGSHPASSVELGKNLPRGVYLMYTTDTKGGRSGSAVVVPVL
jgi:hypothetical protein